MKLPVRPELPDTTVDNDAQLTCPSSPDKSGNVVQTTGATSAETPSRAPGFVSPASRQDVLKTTSN